MHPVADWEPSLWDPCILVIGAGPAGLAAAVTAAGLGLRVVLLDEAAAAGGQYLSGNRPRPTGMIPNGTPNDLPGEVRAAAGRGFQTKAEGDGKALMARANQLNREADARLQLHYGVTVWSLSSRPDGTASGFTAMVYDRGGDGVQARSERMQAEAVILATGARETVVPFPGWTLPGVMTAGAAQLLAKRHGTSPVPPGRRVLCAGSGPLLLPVAVRLAELGAKVVGVLETAHLSLPWIAQAGALHGVSEWAPASWERREESWHYLSTLRKHRIPYLFGRAVVGAAGSGTFPVELRRLETVDVARLDRTGAVIPNTIETWPVDLLCIGYGLVPNIELAQLAGAAVLYRAELGGWVVQADEPSGVQTTVPGLFVAGETAGIKGASAALLSGRIAAMSAATYLGCLPTATLQAELVRNARRQRQHAAFGTLINSLFGAPDGLYRAIPEDTPVCRCEEVTAGQVRAAIAAGARSLDALKPALRVGQGLCQGRTCGPILGRMLAIETGRPVEASGLFQVRPPVKPVPLVALAAPAAKDGSQ